MKSNKPPTRTWMHVVLRQLFISFVVAFIVSFVVASVKNRISPFESNGAYWADIAGSVMIITALPVTIYFVNKVAILPTTRLLDNNRFLKDEKFDVDEGEVIK